MIKSRYSTIGTHYFLLFVRILVEHFVTGPHNRNLIRPNIIFRLNSLNDKQNVARMQIEIILSVLSFDCFVWYISVVVVIRIFIHYVPFSSSLHNFKSFCVTSPDPFFRIHFNQISFVFMYKLIEWIRLLTSPGYSVVDDPTQIMEGSAVNRKRHAKYFLLCLELLPPRLASHDSTRYVPLECVAHGCEEIRELITQLLPFSELQLRSLLYAVSIYWVA